MKLNFDNLEFQKVHDLISKTNLTFFLTGKAGTGKSSFLKHIVETDPKNFVVVAPTGIAAINIRGVTIHSFFQFPLRPILPDDEGIKIFRKNSEKRKIITAMETLIIDEISMVRADLIDGIDYSLRRNGGNPDLPFGGKQVVFIGDIFQLEPVTIKDSSEQNIISEIYDSNYFYRAKVFDKLNLFTIELHKVYRQTDPKFVKLLEKIRVKNITKSVIEKFNSRVFSEKELKKKDFMITLSTRNDLAEIVNSTKLYNLKTKSSKYFAEVSGEFDENKYPTDQELILKEGAQVIFIKNDVDKRWVNGTIGQVNEITPKTIKVKLKNGSVYTIEQRVWENIKYHYNKKKKKIEYEVIGHFIQYPLKLAWAITIHKSQGLTFDRVVIDFGDGTFASGQAYVALSRVKTFEGLFLKKRIHSSDIIVDEEIMEFAKTFSNESIINQILSDGKKVYQFSQKENWEKLGKLFFSKGIASLKINKYNDAYNWLMKGYNYLTCDCTIGDWFDSDVSEVFTNSDSFDCSAYKIDFLKAFIFLFSKKFSAALNAINSFINLQSSKEIGYYFKGKILLRLDKYSEALENFEKALELKPTSRTYYRIGRTKEEFLNTYGLDQMYEAITINPSSGCAHWRFADYAMQRRLYENELDSYQKTFDEDEDHIFPTLLGISIENIFEEKGKQGIFDYLNSLERIMKQKGKIKNHLQNNHDNNYEIERESYGKYAGSYAQEIEGFSDDIIDDVFEGDPDTYWNID